MIFTSVEFFNNLTVHVIKRNTFIASILSIKIYLLQQSKTFAIIFAEKELNTGQILYHIL